MLTLRQYLNQFVRQEHTIELHRLIRELRCTRQNVYAMARGKPTSLDMALRTYLATHHRVDPRTLATNFDWGMLDAYYSQEQALEPPAAIAPAVARAGRSAVAGQAGKRDVQRTGRGTGAKVAGNTSAKKRASVKRSH